MRHIHLDPLGGVAGDMFVAALLDVHPEFAQGAIAAARTAGLDDAVTLAHEPCGDGVLRGSRFNVTRPAVAPGDHGHTHWSALKSRLESSALPDGVRARAIAIFTLLAEAEARVHGKAVADVAFHEVGAWDSIADIVAAAFCIDALAPCTWSIGTLPLGSGRVRTAHGLLPVPAPATVLLLEGFPCFDDGYAGERVTPTGAAIVRHLAPAHGAGGVARRIAATGYGFGTRRFEGMSNVLRAVAFDAAPAPLPVEAIAVIECEIDDQTAEDLALALETLRVVDGVADVTTTATIGKHGRMMHAIRVLAHPQHRDRVIEALFDETTTIGLRVHTVDRYVLPRRDIASAEGVNVKVVERPARRTAKADLRDVGDDAGYANRQRKRRDAEDEVLEGIRHHD